MLSIQPITEQNKAAVCALNVDQTQLAYVSSVDTMLQSRIDKPLEVPYAIVDDDLVVGFCILNFDRRAIAHYCGDAITCGLQGYLIDQRYQGRGYGVRAIAALRQLLQTAYPQYRHLNLTVNSRNEAAKRTYLKAGFVDTGGLYHGGPSGPQHIYTLDLDSGQREV